MYCQIMFYKAQWVDVVAVESQNIKNATSYSQYIRSYIHSSERVPEGTLPVTGDNCYGLVIIFSLSIFPVPE